MIVVILYVKIQRTILPIYRYKCKNFVKDIEGYQSSKDGKKLSKLVHVVQQIHLELYKKF